MDLKEDMMQEMHQEVTSVIERVEKLDLSSAEKEKLLLNGHDLLRKISKVMMYKELIPLVMKSKSVHRDDLINLILSNIMPNSIFISHELREYEDRVSKLMD